MLLDYRLNLGDGQKIPIGSGTDQKDVFTKKPKVRYEIASYHPGSGYWKRAMRTMRLWNWQNVTVLQKTQN